MANGDQGVWCGEASAPLAAPDLVPAAVEEVAHRIARVRDGAADHLARGVRAAHVGPEEAHMTIERWPLDDAIAATGDGRITDSKTQIGILAAARRLGR